MTHAHHTPLRVHAALLLVATLFSLNFIISKIALGTFTPLTFAYLRVAGSAIVLNLVFPARASEPLSRADSWRLAGYSMLGIVLNQCLFLAGLALTSAHVSAILMTTLPVFALGAAIVLGRERATATKAGGIALAAAGALLVVGGEGLAGSTKSFLGDLLLLGNSLAYALYLVLAKPLLTRLSPRHAIGRIFAIASVLMLPIAAWPLVHEHWSAIPTRSWIALVIVILGPTVAAYLLSAWALARADSSLVASYTYVQPFLAAILASAFLGERIRTVVVIAAALIFAGVFFASRPPRLLARSRQAEDLVQRP
ncbi:MAG TPA: DMT family transporter [Thermoanaerobaculia bacterium]|nr:DMT family transporter [Thermoanaerobaculia bacterium]